MATGNDSSSDVLKPRQLLNGTITYSAAQECEKNLLHELKYNDQETKFLSCLNQNRDLIRSVVAQHLGLNSVDQCYIADLEQWIRGSFNPNAVDHPEDGFYQTSALMVMRIIWSCYFRRKYLRGPFFLTPTDIHQSNIFVDDDWNIKCFTDLEWACSRPMEMIHPPYWLSNEAIDSITLEGYEGLHAEFMEALVEEESKCLTTSSTKLSSIMQEGWERGTFWCSLALNSPTALFMIFYDYIQPKFAKSQSGDSTFWVFTIPYWTFNTFKFIEQKVKDKEQYAASLREAFKT